MSDKPVVVVGAGLGGLAAACTLSARGHKVVLLERSEWLGGKAAQLNESGFRFDMGPTILTVPSVLKRIFTEAKKPIEDYLELVCLDPQWRSFFTDGTTLDLVSDTDQMKTILDGFSQKESVSAGYERFMDASKKLHEISDRFFFWKSVESIRDTLDLKTTFDISTLKDLLALRMGKSVAGTVRSFVPDERAAQMIDHFTQYVGSSPDASPAVLCSIAHMQTSEGVWYPMGGTRAVPLALTRLAEEQGVDIRTGAAVRRILVENDTVTGVELEGGERIDASGVVSNCDSVLTHRELMEKDVWEKFQKRRNYEPACSGVVLYLGLDKRYEQLIHHNFVFSRDPHEEFDYIYNKGEPAPDPTAYVCAPAITEPAVAPEGGEALYVLVHTPFMRKHHDWSEMLPGYRQKILDKLKSTAGMEDIEQHITFESVLTPQGIHDRYNVPAGAIYGLASHGKFFGAFKPGNRSRDVKGLYLAGGAAHPGPGMPMVMMSGWIAADTLDEDVRLAGTSSAPEAVAF